jgi:hypothetical protein
MKETAKASGQQRGNSSNRKKSEAPITTNGTSEDLSVQATEPDGSPTEKKYQVFLHHLINVSAKFRCELTGPWGETFCSEGGLCQLTASSWDTELFRRGSIYPICVIAKCPGS